MSLNAGSPKLHSHSPEVYSTIQPPCDWKDMSTPTPVFDRYLRTLVDEDQSVAQLLMTTRRNGNTYYKNLSLTLETRQQYQREYGYDGAEFLQ